MRILFVVLLAAAAVSGEAWAADPAPAARSLDQLLENARQSQNARREVDKEREREFLADRNQQQALLDKAKQDLAAATAQSQKLSADFDGNEIKLKELETQLKAREGNLGELFGVTRQVAQDVSSVSLNSLISARHPERDDFLVKLAKSKSLPAIPELEQLWFEMLREMTETGRVARFQSKVVTAEGTPVDREVVSIGGFTAIAGSDYLNYLPGMKQLAVLPRQPAEELVDMARGVTGATSGYVPSIIDPARGALLALSVQRPGWLERISHGEAVGYVILVVGIAGALCAVFQFFYLFRVRLAVTRQLGQLEAPTADNPLGRVLRSFKGDPARIEEDAEVAELRISEAVLREVPRLERFQPFLRLAVAAGPLLGLVGTVIGMIITFQSITESGSSDPKLMAHGIGQAMIATVLGLGIAIPLLFANAGLSSLSRSIVQILDEQSTGLLAEHIETRQRRA